jgi:hypothetical protein
VRIRTWVVRRLAAATNAWLKSHSKRTTRAAPDDVVASQIHPTSADGLLLQVLAGRRVFGCDGGHSHAPDVARAHREITCACGAPNRTWWHYACECSETCQQRDTLIAKVKRATRAFAGDQSAHLWEETLRALHGGAWDTAAETAVITASGVGVSSGHEGRERAAAQHALDEAFGPALHLLRDSVEHDAPAAREAKRLGDDRKLARKLFDVWGELTARVGPRASSILAEGRRHIMTRAGATRQGSIVARFPKKIINLAYFGQVPFGYRQHLWHVAEGARAQTVLGAIYLRLKWQEVRDSARAAAREAKAPGEGWTLAVIFRHMRAVCAESARQRAQAVPAGGEGDDPGGEIGRLEARRSLSLDADWLRAVCADFRGRCGDMVQRVLRLQATQAAADRKRKKLAVIAAARAALLHWGVSGPVPRGVTGVAALGAPEAMEVDEDDDEARGRDTPSHWKARAKQARAWAGNKSWSRQSRWRQGPRTGRCKGS